MTKLDKLNAWLFTALLILPMFFLTKLFWGEYLFTLFILIALYVFKKFHISRRNLFILLFLWLFTLLLRNQLTLIILGVLFVQVIANYKKISCIKILRKKEIIAWIVSVVILVIYALIDKLFGGFNFINFGTIFVMWLWAVIIYILMQENIINVLHGRTKYIFSVLCLLQMLYLLILLGVIRKPIFPVIDIKTTKSFNFQEAPDKAVVKLTKSRRPTNIAEIYKKGVILYEYGLYEEAIEHIKKIVDIYSNTRNILSKCYAKSGPFDVGMEIKKLKNINRLDKIAEKEDWQAESKDYPGVDKAWRMWWGGTSYIKLINKNIERKETLIFEAYGEPAFDVWPFIKVGFDNKVLKSIYVNSSKIQYYQIEVLLPPGEHKFWVSFENDVYDAIKGEDRSFYLGKVYKVKK